MKVSKQKNQLDCRRVKENELKKKEAKAKGEVADCKRKVQLCGCAGFLVVT